MKEEASAKDGEGEGESCDFGVAVCMWCVCVCVSVCLCVCVDTVTDGLPPNSFVIHLSAHAQSVFCGNIVV